MNHSSRHYAPSEGRTCFQKPLRPSLTCHVALAVGVARSPVWQPCIPTQGQGMSAARCMQVGLLVSSPAFAEASKYFNAFRLIAIGLGVWTAAAVGCALATGAPYALAQLQSIANQPNGQASTSNSFSCNPKISCPHAVLTLVCKLDRSHLCVRALSVPQVRDCRGLS